MKHTLIVNLFGGPSCGKSTIAAGVFHALKLKEISCELVTEEAKSMVWAGRQAEMDNQIWLFGLQYHKIWCLLGQVDVIVTDGPILLGIAYDKTDNERLHELIYHTHIRLNNYNIFLNRNKKYNPIGRNQTEEEALQKDEDILRLFHNYCIDFDVYSYDKDTVDKITTGVQNYAPF